MKALATHTRKATAIEDDGIALELAALRHERKRLRERCDVLERQAVYLREALKRSYRMAVGRPVRVTGEIRHEH